MDIKKIVCSPSLLRTYFIFPSNANITAISYSLCHINSSRIPEITWKIQQQIDVAKLVNIVSMESICNKYSCDFWNYDFLSEPGIFIR